MVDGVDLHAGAAALAVEAGSQVGDVLPPHRAVGLLDALQVPPRGPEGAVQPGAQCAVGDGQAGLARRGAGVVGAGEVVRPASRPRRAVTGVAI